LTQTVSQLLKVRVEDIDVDAEWKEIGFDQFVLSEFINIVNEEYGFELTPNVVLEHLTLRSFIGYLVEEHKNIFVEQFQLEMAKTSVIQKEEKVDLAIPQDVLWEKAIHYFKRIFSSVIKLPAHKIETDVPLEKYGIDSIMVMKLNNELEKVFGSLSKTLLFEYQNIQDLTGYFFKSYQKELIELLEVRKMVSKTTGNTQVSLEMESGKSILNSDRRSRFIPVRVEKQQEKIVEDTDIAIIGVSGRYPEARDLSEFWKNLRDGKDCITEIPKDRWDHSLYFDENKDIKGKTYGKWGGFLEGVDQFDPLFFNISPREAEMMDPQERLFLQCVYETLEDAG
ncbi:thioester reductase, partial [Bacillus wiedmannii]|uniref:phosphopantetheine-binding protein n=1 Tax=Bacillus wiedmannii TaxID=1890302 RepID=UPI000BFAC29B